jgi:hypothetical protein
MKIQNAYGRFIEKLYIDDKTGCWLFVGAKGPNGYCTFQDENGKVVRAHRWAYTHFTNKEIPEGLDSGHTCPNGTQRDCMNPKHLKPMTKAENALWMVKEGRGRKKHKTPRPVSDAELKDIQTSHSSGESAYSIAQRLGRREPHVGKLIKGTIKPRKPKPVAPVEPMFYALGEHLNLLITQANSAKEQRVN